MKTLLSSIGAILLLVGTMAQTQAVVIANWSLSNDAVGYMGGSVAPGATAIDSVGGNNFTVSGTLTGGGSVGGPSASSTYFPGGEAQYQYLYSGPVLTGPLSTLNNDFSIKMHAKITDLAHVGNILTTNSNSPGSLHIGTDGLGNWIATINDGGITTVGSKVAVSGQNAEIVLQLLSGVYSFSVNGVDGSTGNVPGSAFAGFQPGNGFFFGTTGGGLINYRGELSDLSIATGPIPEPTTMILLFGGLGAVIGIRRSRKNPTGIQRG